jgi:hypothetical protein
VRHVRCSGAGGRWTDRRRQARGTPRVAAESSHCDAAEPL